MIWDMLHTFREIRVLHLKNKIYQPPPVGGVQISFRYISLSTRLHQHLIKHTLTQVFTRHLKSNFGQIFRKLFCNLTSSYSITQAQVWLIIKRLIRHSNTAPTLPQFLQAIPTYLGTFSLVRADLQLHLFSFFTLKYIIN